MSAKREAKRRFGRPKACADTSPRLDSLFPGNVGILAEFTGTAVSTVAFFCLPMRPPAPGGAVGHKENSHADQGYSALWGGGSCVHKRGCVGRARSTGGPQRSSPDQQQPESAHAR